MRTVRSIAVFIAACAGLTAGMATGLAASGRAALVIGNAAYPDSDVVLATPAGDAKAVSEALKKRGFSVESGENLSREAMQAAVDRFLRSIEPGSVALVYFGGYGIQVGRKNYLVPVDGRIWTEADVLRDGISVEALLDGMAKRRADARVVVLDASRRNPFERRFRSFSMGLAAAPAAPGTLSLFSAATGSVVNDGGGQGGFGAEVARQVGAAEISAEQAFGAVRDAVAKESRNQQLPALVSGLETSFSFDPAAPPKAMAKVQPPKPEEPKARDQQKPRVEEAPAVVEERRRPVEASKQAAAPPADPPEQKAVEAPPAADRAEAPRKEEPSGASVSQALKDFEGASATGTRKSFEDFLGRHASGPLADRARKELRRFDDEKPAATPPRAQYSSAEMQRKAELDGRIAKDPRDEAAYYERGQFFAQRGEVRLALADFDQSIRLNPGNPEAFNNRCWMRAIDGDLPRAVGDCDEALRLRPNFVDALDSRGLVHLKQGSMRLAIADYDAALRVDPSHSSALYGRGVARMRLGESAQGRKDLAGALRLNPAIDKDFELFGIR